MEYKETTTYTLEAKTITSIDEYENNKFYKFDKTKFTLLKAEKIKEKNGNTKKNIINPIKRLIIIFIVLLYLKLNT